MLEAIIILLSAWINRLRGAGAGWVLLHLPGRPLWWLTPVMFGLAALNLPLWMALAFAASWFFWAQWGWGAILQPIVGESGRESECFVEATLLRWAKNDYWLAAHMRMAMAFPALLLATGLEPIGFVLGVLFTVVTPHYYARLEWWQAEVAIGALFGVALAFGGAA